MLHPHSPAARSVLILKPDNLYASALRALTQRLLPTATVHIATSVAAASAVLAETPIDLLLAGVEPSLGEDVLDWLTKCLRASPRLDRVLVVTSQRELRALAILRAMGVHGVFDSATDSSEQFAVALQTVATGGSYWSRSLLSLLRESTQASNSFSRLLTDTEQLVLSIVGGGSDDDDAARELGLSPATVSTVRRSLHRKLGARHRGELMRIAAQSGYVCFTPSGVVRPGFSMLVAACQRRRRSHLECFA